MTPTLAEVKATVEERIRQHESSLLELARRIHANPELGFEEHRASEWIADELRRGGFEVQHGCYGLPTAVRATIGSGPIHVGICAEYDALPDIGHACGHNIIAAAGLGAALGLAEVVDEMGLTVILLGTPAEEGGGGKVLMLERGAFDGIHAAMMVHPAAVDMAAMPGTAVSQFDVAYRGRSAHAGAYPELGVNAADAMLIAQVAIGQLRQQTRGTDRIHGIVTDAGSAVNVIPETTAGRWIVRSDTAEALAALTARVKLCFEAGALATGCTLSITPGGPDYADLRPDEALLTFYQANAQALGRVFPDLPAMVGAATDMGNVSHVVPTIHPMLGLGCLPVSNHQPEFADASIGPEADRAVLDGAIAMAWTALDFATHHADDIR